MAITAERVREILVEQFGGLTARDMVTEVADMMTAFDLGPDDEIDQTTAQEVVWALTGTPSKEDSPVTNAVRAGMFAAINMLDWPEHPVEDDPDRRWSERNDS